MPQGTTNGPWSNGSGDNSSGPGGYDVDFQIDSITVNLDGSVEFNVSVSAVYGVSTTYEAVSVTAMNNSGNWVSGSLASRSGMSGTISSGDSFTVTMTAADDMDIERVFFFSGTSNDGLNSAELFDLRVQYNGTGGYQDSGGDLWGQGEAPGDANTVINLDVVCFAKGTMIKTDRGQVAVEDLTKGTQVWTLDHGFRPIRWISGNTVPATEKTRPVLIKAGALGAGNPASDLRVSQQHRVLLRSPETEEILGEPEALIAAKHLLGTPGITLDRGCDQVTYYHFLFDKHEVVLANDALCESFFPGPVALGALEEQCRTELFEIFPELAEEGFAPPPARLLANARLSKRLTRKHINRRANLCLPDLERFSA